MLQENKALHFPQYESFPSLFFLSIFISANPLICFSETHELELRIYGGRRRGGAEERNLKVILLIVKDNQRLGSEGKEGSVVLATNEIN